MIEIGDLANLYNVELSDINVNGDIMNHVLDMKHENGYSEYSTEMFPHSHRFNVYELPTTVREGETQSGIGEDRDNNKRLDINGYSGYSEMFHHSHRFSQYDSPTTVCEGKTLSEIEIKTTEVWMYIDGNM